MPFPATFTGIMTGFTANLYVQPNPVSGVLTPLAGADLGTRDLDSVVAATAAASAIVIPANNLYPQNVGSFGFSSNEVQLPVAGLRYSQKVPTQSGPESLRLSITYDVGNEPLQILSVDSDRGTTTRSFIITSTLNAGATTFTWYRIFNGRASAINWSASPDNAHLATLDIVPIGGNAWGYAFTQSP